MRKLNSYATNVVHCGHFAGVKRVVTRRKPLQHFHVLIGVRQILVPNIDMHQVSVLAPVITREQPKRAAEMLADRNCWMTEIDDCFGHKSFR